MMFLNPRIISSSGGSYGDNANLNLSELKAIMKNLVLEERPQSAQTAVWATTKTADASTQTTGGRVWAYKPSKKKSPSVKTFSI